jgi:predicted adenylyl cyclase CyaB
MENIEIKYWLSEPEKVERFLQTNSEIEPIWTKSQKDSYYNCYTGRLKLREESGSDGQLISYQRPDSNGSRISHYEIYSTQNPQLLNNVLTDSLGLRVIVQKVRQLFHYRNVRIHLDRVEELGSFLELESVVDEEVNRELARDNLKKIQNMLVSFLFEPVAVSYADLMLKQENES